MIQTFKTDFAKKDMGTPQQPFTQYLRPVFKKKCTFENSYIAFNNGVQFNDLRLVNSTIIIPHGARIGNYKTCTEAQRILIAEAFKALGCDCEQTNNSLVISGSQRITKENFDYFVNNPEALAVRWLPPVAIPFTILILLELFTHVSFYSNIGVYGSFIAMCIILANIGIKLDMMSTALLDISAEKDQEKDSMFECSVPSNQEEQRLLNGSGLMRFQDDEHNNKIRSRIDRPTLDFSKLNKV